MNFFLFVCKFSGGSENGSLFTCFSIQLHLKVLTLKETKHIDYIFRKFIKPWWVYDHVNEPLIPMDNSSTQFVWLKYPTITTPQFHQLMAHVCLVSQYLTVERQQAFTDIDLSLYIYHTPGRQSEISSSSCMIVWNLSA